MRSNTENMSDANPEHKEEGGQTVSMEEMNKLREQMKQLVEDNKKLRSGEGAISSELTGMFGKLLAQLAEGGGVGARGAARSEEGKDEGGGVPGADVSKASTRGVYRPGGKSTIMTGLTAPTIDKDAPVDRVDSWMLEFKAWVGTNRMGGPLTVGHRLVKDTPLDDGNGKLEFSRLQGELWRSRTSST